MLDLSGQGGASLLRTVTGLPRMPDGLSPDRQLELVAEEAALLDHVKSFAHLVNSADIDAVVDAYTDDCTCISPRGRYVGTAEVRRNYELYFGAVRWFSVWTNVTVRFVRPFDDAYVSAYQYSIGVNEAEPESVGAISTDVWRLNRVAGSWRIAERRIDILDNYQHRVLAPSPAQRRGQTIGLQYLLALMNVWANANEPSEGRHP